jgi:hypothetical protein
VDERWHRVDVALRRAAPAAPLDVVDLREWLRQCRRVVDSRPTGPADDTLDAMNAAVGGVGLRPDRRARLVETINSFLARAESYIATAFPNQAVP